VVVVAVNAEQAEDWNGASGREFIEQRERHEQMLGRLRARLLAAAQIQDGENILDIGCGCGDTTIPAELTRQVRDRLMAYASPDGVTMPGAAWLVTAQAV
jgi:2-polyprenyl-3-methyl-5-hydroxy-6-metoxy-1,4-benzoquinol methylase